MSGLSRSAGIEIASKRELSCRSCCRMSCKMAGVSTDADTNGGTSAAAILAGCAGRLLLRGGCATRAAQPQVPLMTTVAAKMTNRAVIREVVQTREGYSIGDGRATLKKNSVQARARSPDVLQRTGGKRIAARCGCRVGGVHRRTSPGAR
jgi:hypothetical protein